MLITHCTKCVSVMGAWVPPSGPGYLRVDLRACGERKELKSDHFVMSFGFVTHFERAG